MKEKILDNLGLKIISIFLAIFIWLLVVNIDDPVTIKTISNVPVKEVNTNAITNQDMVYEVVEGDTVTLRIKGKRTVVDSLSASDFEATADLSRLSITNSIQIEVSTINPDLAGEVEISYTYPDTVKVELAQRSESQFRISVETTGEVADGYAIGTKSATPNMITVSGADSIVKKIDSVVVKVPVDGISQDFNMELEPVFYDIHGDEIDASKLELSIDTVNVYIGILRAKTVGVRVEPTGDEKTGYEVTSIEYQPTEIVIAGPDSKIANISEIVIDGVDITDIDSDRELSVDVLDYLPDDIILVDESSDIVLNITVEKLVDKNLALGATDIEIKSPNDQYNYKLELENNEIKIIGLNDIVQSTKIKDLEPSIDVKDLLIGEHKVDIKFEDKEGITIGETTTVKVVITQKTESASESSSEESSEATY